MIEKETINYRREDCIFINTGGQKLLTLEKDESVCVRASVL